MGMALQRTFSGFPSGGPGYALLLLRYVVGGTACVQAALLVDTTNQAATGFTVAAALVILIGLAVIIGCTTPIASALLCLGGILATIESGSLGQLVLFESWNARLEFIAMSAALIPLGPGAYSLDARLYGRREIEVNGNGS